jgi:uncharacterized phage protein (TIGR01671 family)
MENMTREIKFRVWDKSDEIMEEVGAIDWADGKPITCNTKKNKFYQYQEPSDCTGFVLMQYTGLKDRNGKEVWEGDIVRIKNGPSIKILEVSFASGAFGNIGRVTIEDSVSELGLLPLDRFVHNSEVIGNIYENPEFIKP